MRSFAVLIVGPHFRLLTLGVPMLVSAAGEAVRYRTRKHFALLIRLALEPGRKFIRDYLIDLLWPEAPAERGRHSLSQAITVLRNSIGREFLSAHRSTLALADGVIDVDALRLERCETDIRGRFLEGFDLRGARGFDEWREGWSARLHPKIRDCLVKHMDAARRIGDFTTVERHALVLEDLDPHSEDAVRGIMEARAWVGDRSNALKAFNRFSTRMAEDFGARPSPELERVAGLLREGRRAAPRPTSEGPPPKEERRFEAEAIIGREREFSVLYDAWLEVRHRKPRVMVVLGDPGMGKTTLTNSFVSSCQMEGAVIARAQAYDAERELPYALLAELVRQLTLQRAIGAAEPEALAELSRLSPDILAVFPGVPSPAEWPPEVVPLRFADAFLKAVTAAADDNPVVLVVDDIHAADNASVGILHMLARKLSGLRLMLILAGRPAELRTSGAPSALATDSAIEGLQTIQLEGFSAETGAALVARIGGDGGERHGTPPTDRILKAGAGNPLAIELLTREWTTHGADSLLRQLEALDALPAPTLGIPIAIRTVFERQARRLDARTRGVLDLAAVLGRRLGDLQLYEIVNCSPGEAAAHLSELLESGLVRDVWGELEFRNELMRAQAYYRVAEPVRRQLHRRVADKLRTIAGAEQSKFQLEIAWHYLRGGNPAAALPHALAGATVSTLSGAPSEAEQILSVLVSEELEGPAGRQIRLLLAKAMLDQSKASEASPLLELLSIESPELKDFAEVAVLRARAEYLLNHENGRGYSQAVSAALSAARGANDGKLLISALFESARAGVELGMEETLIEARSEIQSLLTEPDYDSLHEAHYALAYCEAALNHAPLAEIRIIRAIELLGDSGDATKLSRLHTGLGATNHMLCKLPEASQAFSRALSLARKIGDDSRSSIIAANMCTTLTLLGRFDEAMTIGCYAIECGRRVPSQPILVTAYTNMVDAYVLTGRADLALHCLTTAKEWLKHERSWLSRLTLFVEEASFHLMMKDEASFMKAMEYLEREASGRIHFFFPKGIVAKYQAYKAARVGDPFAALKTVTQLTEQFRNGCPMAFLDTLAAKAFLERITNGQSDSHKELLLTLDRYGMRGKRAMLEREGFVQVAGQQDDLLEIAINS